ncbi:MAG: hypothetical protein K5682_02550 [Lachnospiraceae bacterium]|nr:hypothetical protein [Lachnospiraceae bacterium]
MKHVAKQFFALMLVMVLCAGGFSMTAYAAPQTMADGGTFDPEFYAATYPDVAAALGTDANALYQHYLNHGKAEGRLPYEGATASTGTTATVSGPGARLVDANTVSLSASLSKAVSAPNGVYNVYAIPPADYAVAATATPIAQVAASKTPSFTFALPANGLYMKYVFGVNNGTSVTLVNEPQYITNPEVVATNTKARVATPAKGLQGKLFYNYNIDTGAGVGFNSLIYQVNNYGSNAALNSPNASKADAHHPTEGPFLYMLNTSNMTAVVDLANRLHNFAATNAAQDIIIGNEVNVRKWNYVAYSDWDSYVREYTQVFRVAYNAIKSANANARVFICLDQNWDRNRPKSHQEYYEFLDGKDFLEKFNSMISATGNVNWGVACHPHTVPLTWARFWNMSGCADGAYCANQVKSGKMMSFQNLGLLTSYMTRSEMTYGGAVRPIICTEVSISAQQGADVQGAAMYAAYMAAARSPYIETIVFAENPAIGSGFTDQAKAVYENLGNGTHDAWAKSVIGISDWGQVLK